MPHPILSLPRRGRLKCLLLLLAVTAIFPSPTSATNAQVLGVAMVGTPGGATTALGNPATDEIASNTPLFGTAAEDTTLPRTLDVTIQHTTAGATISFRLQYVLLKLM